MKVAVFVTGCKQLPWLVAVKVTVTLPPHALGAVVVDGVTVVLQPPVALACANHAANFVSMSACV